MGKLKVMNVKRTIMYTVVILILSFAIMFFFSYREIKDLSDEIMETERNNLLKTEDTIVDELEKIVRDVRFFANLTTSEIETGYETHLGNEYAIFAKSSEIYDQIRYIDQNGQEKIRVNYSGGVSTLVDPSELQDKSDRDYYKSIVQMNTNDIYISDLDLNRENGELELPYKPVIRVGTKIEHTDGVFLVNFLAEDLFDKLDRINANSDSKLYLVNSEGYYLYSNGDYKDFSYEFEDYDDRLENHFNVNLNELHEMGQVITGNTLLTYDVIKLPLAEGLNKQYESDLGLYVITVLTDEHSLFGLLEATYVDLVQSILLDNSLIWLMIILVSFTTNYLLGLQRFKDDRVNRTLKFIAQLGWKEDDSDFFVPLVRFLSEEFSVEYALVDEIHQGDKIVAKTVALISGSEIIENIEYELDHTPCHEVYGKRLCSYREDIQNLFPKDQMLVDLNVESYVGLPLFASDGEPIGLIALMDTKSISNTKDIEMILQLVAVRAAQELERRIYQKKMKDMVRFNQLVIDTVNEGIVVYDKNLNYLEWNQSIEKISGVMRDEVMGKNILEVFPELQANGIYDELVKTLQTGKEHLDLYEYVNPNKRKYWLKDFNKQLLDEDGNVLGVIKSIVDFTTFKEKEKELVSLKDEAEKANVAKSSFLSNMSHELRTPMNGMLGMIDLTLQTILSDEQTELLSIAKKSGLSLVEILNDILDISSVEANVILIRENLVDLEEVINEVYNLFKPLALEKGLTYRYYVNKEIPKSVYIDDRRIKQISANLIGNALKFTDKGEVDVCVDLVDINEKSVRVRFSYTDTGIGISPEFHDSIFAKFTQVDESSTRSIGGAGLGLSIVKSFVNAMGGEVSCESQVGAGTTFYFELELPYNQDKLNNIEDPSTIEEFFDDNKLIKVMVVDDDDVNRKLIQAYLKKLNIDCMTLDNGQEAVVRFEEYEPDIIFMDLSMPIMDGYETRNIIANKKGCKIPIIIAQTAFAYESDKVKCLELGFDDFISKPIDLSELKSLIYRHVD